MAQELNVVDVYNDLHQIPELGFQEFKTSACIAEKLKQMGYEVTTGVGKTGVVAVEKGAQEGPCVMIRADMDALPFKVNGEDKVIHACGHDSHCAMLLAIASRLQGKIKRGTLKLLFQPGEETLKGALSVIDDGVLEDVDIALGLHIRPATDIPDGTVAAALMHSASIFVRIDVEGLSSHASRPHLGVNCAEMLAAIVQNAGLLKFAPTLTWSMKCTKIDVGGAAINVIPDKGYCMYDVRAQTNPLMKDMLEKLEKSAQSTAACFRRPRTHPKASGWCRSARRGSDSGSAAGASGGRCGPSRNRTAPHSRPPPPGTRGVCAGNLRHRVRTSRTSAAAPASPVQSSPLSAPVFSPASRDSFVRRHPGPQGRRSD